jgi:hypothetical protein
MSGDARIFNARKVPFLDYGFPVAYSAGLHSNEDFVASRLGYFDLHKLELRAR